VVRPHTFAALKELPELRQLISHSAVAVVEAATDNLEQVQDACSLRNLSSDPKALPRMQERNKHNDQAQLLHLVGAEDAAGTVC